MRHSSEKLELLTLRYSDGRSPFDEWFETLSPEDQHSVDNRLFRVRQGNFGEINVIGAGVWELKFKKGKALRIYYCQVGRFVLLLLLGGDKGSQRKDVKRAIALLGAYRRGGLENEER